MGCILEKVFDGRIAVSGVLWRNGVRADLLLYVKSIANGEPLGVVLRLKAKKRSMVS